MLKHYMLFCRELLLWWVVVLEQAGGLHDVIRLFKFILEVFLLFWNYERILLNYM